MLQTLHLVPEVVHPVHKQTILSFEIEEKVSLKPQLFSPLFSSGASFQRTRIFPFPYCLVSPG
jgi:hypothetical protein